MIIYFGKFAGLSSPGRGLGPRPRVALERGLTMSGTCPYGVEADDGPTIGPSGLRRDSIPSWGIQPEANWRLIPKYMAHGNAPGWRAVPRTPAS